MRLGAYFDITIVGITPQANDKGYNAGWGLRVAKHMEKLMDILHGFFHANPDSYAVAYPYYVEGQYANLGNIVRVFASDKPSLERLERGISEHTFIENNVKFGYEHGVPAGYEGPWVEYQRYQLPSQSLARRSQLFADVRESKYKGAESLPFYQTKSDSTNNHKFSVIIKRIAYPAGHYDVNTEILPNTYGLSVSKKAFAVPDLQSHVKISR